MATESLRKGLAIVVSFALLFSCGHGYSQATRRPEQAIRAKFLPPKGKVLVFADGPHNESGIKNWRDITGTEPSGFISWMGDVTDGEVWFFRHQATPENHAILVFLDFNNRWSEIIEGKLDDRIDEIGTMIKESRRPVFVVLGHEFDLNRKHDPKQYVRFFRRIHDRWDRLGASNIAYVWHAVTGFGERSRSWEYYPGDYYVDWFGVSFYHVGNIPSAAQFAACARRRGKPLMLCESGPLNKPEFLNAWGSWYGPYFRFLKDHDVRAIMYWPGSPNEQEPKPGGFGGGALHRLRPPIRAGFVREIGKSSFLQGDDRLFSTIGYKP